MNFSGFIFMEALYKFLYIWQGQISRYFTSMNAVILMPQDYFRYYFQGDTVVVMTHINIVGL